MPIDHRYRRDERLLIRAAVVLGVVIGLLALILASNIGSDVKRISPNKVYSFIEEVATQEGLDPEFVYALAWAESSLNAKARSKVARGIMQMTKTAWSEVSDESYRHAWDWKTNIRVGIDYLVFCREFLKKHNSFSYPLLAASFRYGPYYVKKHDFDLRKIKTPKNEIYLRIFNGNVRPVVPPDENY